MPYASIAWLILFLLNSLALYLLIFSLLLLSDLEHDYLNPTNLCERLNPLQVYEYGGHAFILLLLLLQKSWLAAALNVPLFLWHARRYYRRRHLLDPASVFVRLKKEYQIRYLKLVFYLLNFFYCVYGLIVVLINNFLSYNPAELFGFAV
mmetsp:Transcript_5905/g.9069  ORF Transcript_5905/g.9069 Transcript_5905/m.9069 type:complete len:150 (+) Transcript_5905:111-560(+)